MRNSSLPPVATSGSHQAVHTQMMPPSTQQHQLPAPILNYSFQQPPALYNPAHHPQIQLLNNQYPVGANLQQPLHLHTFQPINNMIISSPPCASPTTAANTNPHSLNNSRSNSPWMMMPPPLPPLQPVPHLPSQQQQQQQLSNGQPFCQVPHHQVNHHPGSRSNSINKNTSSSNLKDTAKQHHQFNSYYNSQDELLIRYIITLLVGLALVLLFEEKGEERFMF